MFLKKFFICKKTKRFNDLKNRDRFFYDFSFSEKTDDIYNTTNPLFISLLSFLFNNFLLFFYVLYNSIHKNNYDVVWGYEVSSTFFSKFMSIILKKPHITSYQGTLLEYSIRRFGILRTFIKFPIDFIGTWIKSDLCIMTDDGTHGLDILLRFHHKKENILFLPNGVDLNDIKSIDTLSKEELNLFNNEIIFLIISRLVMWKRVDRAIELLKYLTEIYKKNFVLYIIGDGNLRFPLEDFAGRLGIKDIVRFIGPKPYKECLRFIRIADMIWSFNDISNLTNTIQDALVMNKTILTLSDGSLYNFINLSPGINKDNIYEIPLEDYKKNAVSVFDKWFNNRYSFSRVDYLVNDVWTWNKRIEYIDSHIKNLV